MIQSSEYIIQLSYLFFSEELEYPWSLVLSEWSSVLCGYKERLLCFKVSP